MYIKDNVAYAGEPEPAVKVVGVRPLPEYRLWVRFSTGEAKTVDFRPLLNCPCYRPLADETAFNGVYIDCGVVTWLDGAADVAPEYLYENGEPADAGVPANRG